MASHMNPMESYVHVNENIPGWLTRLDDLTTQVDDQFKRYTEIANSDEVVFTRPRKYDSTKSLQAARDLCISPLANEVNIDHEVDHAEMSSTLQNTSDCSSSPQEHHDAPVDQNRQLKRKSSSMLSNDSCRSGKSLVVVYYDSGSQHAFEEMVKSIGTARNCLRKGKNAAVFKARLASFGMTTAASPPIFDISSRRPNANKAMPTLGKPRHSHSYNGDHIAKGFIQADRDLEEAQDLCESAAYKMLREGDCRQELEGMRKRLFSCAEIAKREIEKLHSQADAEAAAIGTAEAEQNVVASLPRSHARITGELSLFDEKFPVDHPTQSDSPLLTEIHLPVSTGIMEVDDSESDAGSIHIDMAAIRRTMGRVPRV